MTQKRRAKATTAIFGMTVGDLDRARGMGLSAIHSRLAQLLGEVDVRLARVWQGQDEFIGHAAERALLGPGKRLRPTILLLAAECSGRATEHALSLASVVEVVHAASLIHDDVLDSAPSRRGRRSPNALWDNKISVLLGDYLIARALDLLPAGHRERWVPELAELARRMCEGQIRELRAAGRALSEGQYLDIARAKTGSIFAFCGSAGAEMSGGPPGLAAPLRRFGESFGIAFQVADDILDLVGTDGQSGKPEGRDAAERKFTLPLILAAESSSEARAELGRIFAKAELSQEDVQAVRALARSAGAVDAAWQRVAQWLQSACEQLGAVPESDAKQALIALCGDRFPMPVMAD